MTRGLAMGLSAAAMLGVMASSAVAGVKSGLQEGDRAGAFNVRDITGPNKGKSLCYR